MWKQLITTWKIGIGRCAKNRATLRDTHFANITTHKMGESLLEFALLLRTGEKQSARMPLTDSQAVMETLDRVRAEIGLRYPFE